MTKIDRLEVWAVYCPECRVAPGEHCVGARGAERERPHALRAKLARMGFVVLDRRGLVAGFLELEGNYQGEPTEGVKEGSSFKSFAVSTNQPQEAEGLGTKRAADEDVESVWAKWVELRRPRRTAMPTGTAKQLQRALAAGYSVADLVTMMEALLASDWHRERDQLSLSSVFATKPGGKTFEDQLDTWLARGESPSSSPAAGDASVTDAAVAAAKNTVRQTWGRDSHAAVELRTAALERLERYGWKVSESSNGQPVFSRA